MPMCFGYIQDWFDLLFAMLSLILPDYVVAFVLVDSVEIPPNNDGQPVSIYFYVLFSASGSENLEDMTFSIGTINFLTI